MSPCSSFPSYRSRSSRSSSTPYSHSIDRNIIRYRTPHLCQCPNHSSSCHPRHHAEASLVSGGTPGTAEMMLGLQQGGDAWMMAQSPRLKGTNMRTIYQSWTPRKTRSGRFECASLRTKLSFIWHASQAPFTIRIYNTSRRWFRIDYCIRNPYLVSSAAFSLAPTPNALLIAAFQIRQARNAKIHTHDEGAHKT